MLIFFIHGVATPTIQYAEELQLLVREEFLKRGELLPHFYSSFWADVLSDVGKMWNWIHQDLQEIKKQNPNVDIQDIFRYQKFREGFLSKFVGDFFTYLNPERGAQIRKLIAQQLYDFLKKNPNENDLHIIAHSLGTVILWDVLFSERFSHKDPAFYIRSMIHGLSDANAPRKVYLKSITTMASPILFMNTMLDVRCEKIKEFANTYHKEALRWINLIHSSDIIAYPLKASLNLNSSVNLSFKDEYISTDANLAEKAARTVNENAALALGVADAHDWYLHCHKTARLITDNIIGEQTEQESSINMMQKAIQLLEIIPGMTKDQMRLHIKDEPVELVKFKDDSGKIHLVVNAARVYHVYVFDNNENCSYSGYVGWIHTDGLKKEVEFIKKGFAK